MSYDISFKVKIDCVGEHYTNVTDFGNMNITYNLKEMIVQSTGLEWKNGENNGQVKDIIPSILRGLNELILYPEKYKQYEYPIHGWGTISGCIKFFNSILQTWENVKNEFPKEVCDVMTFWIE